METVLSADIQELAQHQASLCKVFSSAQSFDLVVFSGG
jgi:hypothetical protein